MAKFDIEEKQKRIKKLEELSQEPGFWQNKERAKAQRKELTKLYQEIKDFQKYNKGNAVLQVSAGAGGQDSQDWTTMLLRMYQNYCQKKGLKTKILHQSFGQSGGPEGRIGTKSVTLEIKGRNSYGLLKKESGVHRLVRLSPFSAKALRHTSFALVEILPELSPVDQSQIKLRPEDLKIDTFRASGPGGQYVNKRESAVRITHLPAKITVSCQSERLQGVNKQKAMALLYAKLYQLKEAERERELKRVGAGPSRPATWGNQIRSYVLHPYKLVKDLRTGVETSNVDEVLDGNLDLFVEAETKL